ncbi:MAG: poly(U)-specific 3'-to-5' RNA exonuclease [Chrysothrix sp. TS-e1954]|nr:MAG: poly(U)-specific 3'-to-5' RNA exonuclease [Chrysothrix sp. TS-e1954]
MGLVDYASSSDSDAAASSRPLKRKRSSSRDGQAQAATTPPSSLPPLPSTFRDLYTTAARVSTRDDPALHGGRKRAVPHVEGNWPTHVYLEWYPTEREAHSLQRLISALPSCTAQPSQPPSRTPQLHSSLHSSLGAPLPLHISLSSPLILQTPQRTPFTTSLRRAVTSFAAETGAFDVVLGDAEWLRNSEGTRWFLALRIKRQEGGELGRLLDACNKVCRGLGLRELYAGEGGVGGRRKRGAYGMEGSEEGASGARVSAAEDRADGCVERFHFSIAWTVDPPVDYDRDTSNQPPPALKTSTADPAMPTRVRLDEVKLKIGNAVTSLPLSRKRGGEGEERNRTVLG